ncbi:MAG: hypothetical protein FWE47_01015 [Oscillospiraceae bacterium]|nr:hypothetical protein [Oscillospiraceae bacterium]
MNNENMIIIPRKKFFTLSIGLLCFGLSITFWFAYAAYADFIFIISVPLMFFSGIACLKLGFNKKPLCIIDNNGITFPQVFIPWDSIKGAKLSELTIMGNTQKIIKFEVDEEFEDEYLENLSSFKKMLSVLSMNMGSELFMLNYEGAKSDEIISIINERAKSKKESGGSI